ncbi:Z1 domain-containing protein [Ornithinimicrobium sp. Arc0846-15]|nr:Z1 domain-containing protein [Ornithinimicrobium laminariae]
MTTEQTWLPDLAAALTAMKSKPRPLLAMMDFLTDDPVSESDLDSFIRGAGVNNSAFIQTRISLSEWDSMPSVELKTNTEPRTPERRVFVYDQLGLGRQVRAALDSRAPVFLEQATVISTTFDPWYNDRDQERGSSMYWDHYEMLLRDTKQWPGESIASLDVASSEVVQRLSDPQRDEAKQTKGLVVGYVQSGKTANFTGVIAKSIDAGYRLVIVLTGTIELLRAQTQRRLDMELVGRENLLQGQDPDDPKFLKEFDYTTDSDWVEENFIEHGHALDQPGIPAIRRVTTRKADYRRLPQGLSRLRFQRHDRTKRLNHPDNLAHSDVHIAIVKKNAAPLQKLIEDLRPIRKDLADLPVLIIDDESDQATPNTKDPKKSAKEVRDRTKINKLISDLLALCPRAQYVAYTATPFANVFIDPDDERDLFPSDFVLSLERPQGYMGVSDFHDIANRWDDEKKTFANCNEKAHVRAVSGDPTDPVLKERDLRAALDAFVLSGGIKAYRETITGQRYRHHTMLVHESVRRQDQQELAEMVRKLWQTAEYATAGMDRLELLYTTDYLPVMQARSDTKGYPKTFEELKRHIGVAIARVGQDEDPVLVINSDAEIQKQQKSLDFDADSVWRILVGGAKLSRGFTVEGLTVSYFGRKAMQADTLMQAGRWFGFRPGYQDLVRLYIRRDDRVDLYDAFEALLMDEESFRAELRRYEGLDEDGRPLVEPRQIPPMVSQHLPWLKPTARNKMFNAYMTSRAPANSVVDLFGVPERDASQDKQHNFDRVVLPLLRSTSPTSQTLLYSLEGNRGSGTVGARVGVVSAAEVIDILGLARWHPEYRSTVDPLLEFVREATNENRIHDWAVVWPQPKTAQGVFDYTGVGSVPVIKRGRRQSPRIDFVGSDAKHRAAAQTITRGQEVPGLGASHTRGALLLTVTQDIDRDDFDPDAGDGSLIGLMSIGVPASATPNRRDLIRWSVKAPHRPDDVVVDRGGSA